MKLYGKHINWSGMLGAAVLFWYGWWREPLAAVLGGLILLVDFLTVLVSGMKKR